MLKLALRLTRPTLGLRTLRRGGVIALGGLMLAWALTTFAGSNSHAVVAGRVYRTSQLSGESLGDYLRDKQIRTVINLRGFCPGFEWYTDEAAAIAAAGVSQEDITLSANRLPPPGELARLIEVLDSTDYPVVLHCKQGADRTGLASAVVLLLYTDASLGRARQELWPHRGHFPVARTQAMDEFFDRYEAWLDGTPHTSARFRDWAGRHYKPGPAAATLQWLTPIPESLPVRPFALTLRATNTSNDVWHFKAGTTSGIHLVYRLYDAAGVCCVDDQAGLVRREVAPGASIDLSLAFPKLPPGSYTLRAEMADFIGAGVPVRAKYFFQGGVDAAMATIVVR